jgi:hypothetical protein
MVNGNRGSALYENRLRSIIIVVAVLLSYAYFYHGDGWNQYSRFDLTRALVEHHTFRIDAYHRNTGDKAFFNGHYYSDKAPGLALAAVPVWEAANAALLLAGKDPLSERAINFKSYLSTIILVSIPTALAVACAFLLSLEFGASVGGGLFGALVCALATPMWCYATLFWGHAPAGAFLLFAYAGAWHIRASASPRRDLWLSTGIGLLGGWATLTDFTAAPAAAILAFLALSYAWPTGRSRTARVVLGIALGGLVCVAILFAYQMLVFGSPLNLGYMHHAFPGSVIEPTMKEGFVGLTYPKMHALREILIGSQRGLLPLSPVLVLAPLGLVLLWRNPEVHKAGVAAASIATYFVLLNASFHDWWGGSSFGPRYLSLGLPFLALGLAPLWTRSRWMLRSALGALAFCGAAMSLMAVSANSQPPFSPFGHPSPVQEFLWPAFRLGHLPWRDVEWNLGQCAGLWGLRSLLPLLIVWVLALAAWLHPEPRFGPSQEASAIVQEGSAVVVDELA